MSTESAQAMFNNLGSAPAESAPATPTTEPAAKPDAAPATEPSKELESTRFKHLAKKELEIQRKMEEYKKKQEGQDKERENILAIKKQWEDYQEALKSDKLKALKLAGFSDTDLINLMSEANTEKSPAEIAREEIQRFKDEQLKSQQSAQQAEVAKNIKLVRNAIDQQITSDQEKYEFMNYHGPEAQETVLSYIQEVYKENGVLLSVEEAVDAVEEYYTEQSKLMQSKIKKLGSKPAEAPAPLPSTTKSEASAPMAPATIVDNVTGRASLDILDDSEVKKLPELPQSAFAQPLPSKTLTNKASATSAGASRPNGQETEDQKKERLNQKLYNLMNGIS